MSPSAREPKAAFRAGVGASAFFGKSGRDMLNLSLSVDDPERS
jgi:hypothetical protein